MNEKINELLREVRAKINSHEEFKAMYNSQLAFDFNIFNFFKVGENKVSEILAFILNPKESHGQGDRFLTLFFEQFVGDDIKTDSIDIVCEKVIENDRRIDLLIKYDNKFLAIENKIWADDQKNQLLDYATYLDKISSGKYLLLYLNPYCKEPNEKSINKSKKEELIDAGKLKIISYENDINSFLKSCISQCEAENVRFFLKEFTSYINKTIYRHKTLNMSENIKNLISSNTKEAELIVQSYNSIMGDIIHKIDKVGKSLLERDFKLSDSIKVYQGKPFNYEGKRVFKIGFQKGKNKVYIGFLQNGIELQSHFHIHEKNEIAFNAFLIEGKKLKDRFTLNRNQENLIIDNTEPELIKHFLIQLSTLESVFEDFQSKVIVDV